VASVPSWIEGYFACPKGMVTNATGGLSGRSAGGMENSPSEDRLFCIHVTSFDFAVSCTDYPLELFCLKISPCKKERAERF
jgi:hypothetical protein